MPIYFILHALVHEELIIRFFNKSYIFNKNNFLKLLKKSFKMKNVIILIAICMYTFTTIQAQDTIKRATGRPVVMSPNTTTVKPTATVPIATTKPPTTTPKSESAQRIVPMTGTAVFNKQKTMPDGSVIKQNYTVSTMLAKNLVNNGGDNVMNAKPIKNVISTSTPNRTPYGQENCQTIQTRITASNLSELNVDFSAAQQAANIYPGALYKFDDFYSGNWNTINYGRNPITLVSSVNTSDPTQVVNDPSFANIKNSIAKIFTGFPVDANKIRQEGLLFKVYEVENQAELAFKIGGAGHYMGISASNMFSSANKEKHKYLLIDATKEMFTINVQPPQNGIMVDPNATTADMMYINSVTYGARVLACVELDTYDKEVADKVAGGLDWGFVGGQASLETKLRELKTTMRISFYAVGGRSIDAKLAYSFEDVKILCNDIISNLNYQTSQPIKYQFKNRNNEVVKSSSATDNFITQSCTLDRDMKVTASITGINPINQNETDIEIYGQAWAQVFDKNGKEIMPAYNKDRLMDIKDNQHLNKIDFKGGNSGYSPNISTSFTIPKDVYVGSKIVIYYWMMDYDGGSGDDFLAMRNGNGIMRKYNRNNLDYYVHEYYFKGGEGSLNDGLPFIGEFVDRDGESAIKIGTMIKVEPIPLPK